LAEPCQAPFYAAAFDAMDLGPGVALLDAGCGAGLALVMAKSRGAIPTGLDASAGLLGIARERLGDADLREGDLEELPFADHVFDVASAFNSVQFASDPNRALSEIRRVVKSGAPVAVATWGSPDRCEMAAVLRANGSVLPPPPPGAGGPFALSAPGALETLVEAAGLEPDRVIEVPTPYVFADVETGIRAQLASGPGRRAIEHAGEEATRSALRAAFAPFVRPDGTVSLNNVFRVLIARA
jgi:SAM-dependent methyltransferase